MRYRVTKGTAVFQVGDIVDIEKRITKKIWAVRSDNGTKGNILVSSLDPINPQPPPQVVIAQPQVVLQPQVVVVQPPPFVAAVNPAHHWLRYETRSNADRFQKTDQQRRVGLHLVPLGLVEVNAVADIPDDLIAALFPGYTKPQILTYSGLCKNWIANQNPPAAPDVTDQHGSRAVLVINAPGYVVMPFNYADNDRNTRSLGVSRLTDDCWRLRETWPLWKTASRSCVTQVAAVDVDDIVDDAVNAGDRYTWDFAHPTGDRNQPIPDDREGALGGDTCFQIARDQGHAYSIKTGVCYIGKQCQTSKDHLDQESLIGRLRTDYVDRMNTRLRPANQLVLMRELLSVTMARWVGVEVEGHYDGLVVRDLSRLEADKIYVPTLSIPYAGEAIVAEYNHHAHTNETYDTFFCRHYAEELGRTKAKLLLRYGLQCLTPNPQNFLLEFNAQMAPTGRIFLRDIGDANLHKQVVFAINSADSANVDPAQLQDATLRYEYTNPHGYPTLPEDTVEHKTPASGMYPPHTQLHWAQYSLFKPWGVPETREQKKRNAVWGRAHNAAYIGHLNQVLGLNADIDVSACNATDQLLNNAPVVLVIPPGTLQDPNRLRARVTALGSFPLDLYDDALISLTDLEKLERYLELLQVAALHARLIEPATLARIKIYHATLT